MELRVLLQVTLAMVWILPLQPSEGESRHRSAFQEGGAKSYKLISHETHDRVLDIVFPRDEIKGDPAFVLRFEPSLAAESQIVIRRAINKIEVLEYTSLSGNIYSKLNGVMAQGGKEDAVEMAKLIKVRRRSLEVSYSKVKGWHTGFLNSFSDLSKSLREQSEQLDRAGTSTIVLDGTLYQLWYNQAAADISFRVWDVEVSDKQPNGILKTVQWMNAVRNEVRNLK